MHYNCADGQPVPVNGTSKSKFKNSDFQSVLTVSYVSDLRDFDGKSHLKKVHYYILW